MPRSFGSNSGCYLVRTILGFVFWFLMDGHSTGETTCIALTISSKTTVWRTRLLNKCIKVRLSVARRYFLMLSFVNIPAAGNLSLIFPGELQSTGNFNHSLDLTTAIATTTYTTSNGNRVTRTSFASHPDNVIVMRIQVANSGTLKFEAKFNSPMANVVSSFQSDLPISVIHCLFLSFRNTLPVVTRSP